MQGLSIVVAASIISLNMIKDDQIFADPPCQKRKILVSKYVTSVLASIWLFIIYYGFSLLFGLLFFGVKLDEKAEPLFINTVTMIGTQWFEVWMMVSFAFLCSALFKSSALSIMVSIVVLYGAKMLVTIMSYLEKPLGKFCCSLILI